MHSVDYPSKVQLELAASVGGEPQASVGDELRKKEAEEHCLTLLEAGQLIATGMPDKEGARALIPASAWAYLRKVRWEVSGASDGREGGLVYADISVFPPLLAPNRVELLADKPLAQVCRQFMFNDPEVAALSAEALQQDSEFGRVLREARCYVRGVPEWPLAFDRWAHLETVHPDPALQSVLDIGDPDPIEVVLAAGAIKHRYRMLVSMLRERELVCAGISAREGEPSAVLVSVWFHEDFHLDMARGDILQVNPESTDWHDRLVTRWFAVVLERGTTHVHRSDYVLHVKPTAVDNLRPTTPQLAVVSTPHSKGRARIETKSATRKACLKWLIELMRQSPDVRTRTVPELWSEAQSRWPKTLSHRAFLDARAEAIRESGAVAWAAAGAPPKKSARAQSPR